MQIIGKGYSIEEFKNYVSGIKFSAWRPSFVVVHNTSVPSQALYKSWHAKPGWTGEQWMKNLAAYYSGMGWNGCPHLFVAYDKIWVLNPLDKRGTHTPSWNSITWGVETVAEFQSEPFDGGVKENLIAALAILHEHAGLNPDNYKLGVRGLHLHKEDKASSHQTCPGKNIVKKDLIASVIAYMNGNEEAHHDVPIVSQEAEDFLTDIEATSVTWLQTKLNRQGYKPPLEPDGKVGPKTIAAVKWFQAKNIGLKADGIAGPLTRKALKDADWAVKV